MITQISLAVASHLTCCIFFNRPSDTLNIWLYIKGTNTSLHVNDKIHVSQGFQGFGFGDGGFQMSFGIGAFPFGIFATAFNINDGRPPPGIYVLNTSPLCVFLSTTCQITSVKQFPKQRPLGHHNTWMNSFCLDSSCLSLW